VEAGVEPFEVAVRFVSLSFSIRLPFAELIVPGCITIIDAALTAVCRATTIS
jgi:hypothetical protein